MTDFIELDRRFIELGEQIIPEDYVLISYTLSLGRAGTLGWNELLQNPLVVILGEAGSGKTYEFQHQAEVLKSQKKFAFFVRLDGLANGQFENVLMEEDFNLFRKWQDGNDDAVFFLDSVDEAKFHKLSDFYGALDVFRKTVGFERLQRAKILISSRISEWQPSQDRNEVLHRFKISEEPPANEEENDSYTFRPNSIKKKSMLIVQLLPLDEDRVRTFIEQKRVPDADSFIENITRNYAWEFTRRPIDAADLINYWSTYKRLGSLTDLLEFSITENLKPSDRDMSDPLSPQQAREGAEFLAASAVLSKQFSFAVPDKITSVGFDPRAGLPENWSQDMSRALLRRPLFDSESYGKIRFHHRRIAEYLTSKWFERLLEHGCPIDRIEDLLFERIRKKVMVRESLIPEIAWLCSGTKVWNESIRNLVLESAPETLLKYGDPSQWPTGYKKEIFQSIVRKLKGRGRIWISASAESLSRLADTGLSEYVTKLIKNRKLPAELREIMIRLARFGRLESCVKELLDIISSNKEALETKIVSVAAIRDAGDIETRQKLLEIVTTFNEIPTELSPLICEAIYPKVVGISELVKILKKTASPKEHNTELGFYLSHHFQSVVKPQDAAELLQNLVILGTTPPHIILGTVETKISAKFRWLWEVIPLVTRILLTKSHLTDSEVEIVSNAIRLLGHSSSVTRFHEDNLGQLDAATLKHPSVRRRYSWDSVEKWRLQNEREPLHYSYAWEHLEVIKPNQSDFEWLVEDIRLQGDPRNRELAVNSAIELWYERGRSRKDLRQIRDSISGDRGLLTLYRRSKARWRFLKTRRFLYKMKHSIGSEYWWTRLGYKSRQWRNWLRNQQYLYTHLELLSSARNAHALAILCREADPSNNRLTVQNWNGPITKRGRPIVNAVKRGCKLVWKQYDPPYPHEMKDPNSIPDRLIAGLAGIQLEVDEGNLDFSTLSQLEVEKLVRYALQEMNGYPEWFYHLYELSREFVESVLLKCIKGEWQFPPERKEVYRVIHHLIWQGDRFSRFLEHSLLQLIETGDPTNAIILDAVVQFLTKTVEDARGRLAQIASQRIAAYSPDGKAYLIWLKAWLELDCLACISFLKKVLDGSSNPVETMMTFLASFMHRPHEQLSIPERSDYLTPSSLKQLIPFIHKYIRTQDDVKHPGGIYTPGPRDDAEHFRGTLLQRLAINFSPEAGDVLRSFLTNRFMRSERDYIIHVIEERERKKVNLRPWPPSLVKAFAYEFEVEPRTDHDLFKIVNHRLLNIKHDVERADTSIRQDLHKDDDEIRLRKWFATQLRTRASNRYKVPEEEEIDQRQRPDLRIENPNVAGPISIEIKWADNWSLAELKERLANQLVGQYLRDADAHYGIYLLGYIGRKKSWADATTRRRYNLSQVASILQKSADHIASRNKAVYGINVVAINFVRP